MKLFGGNKTAAQPPVAPPVGRRRPGTGQDSIGNQAAPRAAAFSYYSQRSGDERNTNRSSDVQAVERGQTLPSSGRPRSGRRRTATLAATGVVVLAGLYASIVSPEPRVVLLQDGTTAYFLQDPAVYRQAASQVLGGSLFNRSKLTIDTTAVRGRLLQDYPEIKDVTISMPLLGHQPQLYIEPYTPSFILTTTSNNAYLLDATGRALATTNEIPDIASLGVYTMQDRSGRAVEIGSRAIPSSTINFARTVVAALEAKDVNPASLTLLNAYEIDIQPVGVQYVVKFNIQADPLEQAGAFLATKNRLASDKITPANYIDVRVLGRSYYK